jgi:hypothetical protein
MGTLREDVYVRLWYLPELLLEWKIFQIEFVEKIKTQFCVQYFSENHAFYERMWKNLLEPGRPQMAI